MSAERRDASSGPSALHAPGRLVDADAYAPGFCAQTLHQPPAGTLLPAKILQPAVASPAFPWNCAQVLHFCVGLNVGFAAASTLDASVVNPKACAVGSLGSSGGSPAAAAESAMRPMAGMSAPAISPPLTIVRREILLCMVMILWGGKTEEHFLAFPGGFVINKY